MSESLAPRRPGGRGSARGRPRDPGVDEAIILATLELLDERGYVGLSLAEVALRAGVSRTALYRRWDSKAQLVVDCSGLRYVDSSGLGALVRALTTSQHEGGGTKLLGVQSSLRKLLELTKLDSVFEMFEHRDEAVSSF